MGESQSSGDVLRLRQDAATWRDVDGEVVVLDLVASRYLGINGSGRVLWLALADGATESERTGALVREFGVPEDRARADVLAFVGDLRRRGLLEE